MIFGRLCSLLPLAASAVLLSSCKPVGLQGDDQFAWAIEGASSTGPPIVRVKLTNSQNGVGSVRCLTSSTLIYAILSEAGLRATDANWQSAVKTALNSRDHSFNFVRPEPWRAINAEARGYTGMELAKGCKLIEEGKSAALDDRSGRVYEGRRFPM